MSVTVKDDTPKKTIDLAAASERSYRRSRLWRFLMLAALCVLLPTILSALYYGFLATRFYVAESKFIVQKGDGNSGASLGLFFAEAVGAGSNQDIFLVEEYVLSRDALRRLDEEYDFLEVYRDPSVDWAARLSADATFEDAFVFYQDLVEVVVDTQSQVALLTVRAPRAVLAKQFTEALLSYSEEVVNRLSARAQSDRLAFARQQVADSEDRLLAARVSLQGAQREVDEFNPMASAEGVGAIRFQLEGELATTRAELDTLAPVLQPNAHQLVMLRNKVRSLERQIQRENQRLVGDADGSFSDRASSFEAFVFEKEFAEANYQSALQFLELSRLEASQQSRYLAVVVSPTLPDEALYPETAFAIATVFFVSLSIFLIGAIMIAIVREHARV